MTGSRYRIAHFWVFMLLGQLVAISVAANLSFITILGARRQSKPSRDPEETTRRRVGAHLIIIISSACAALTQYVHADKRFIVVLLIPHIAAFVPMTIPWLKPDVSVYHTVAFLTGTVFAHATWRVLTNGWTVSDILVALHEYPAVSSAGWDVIWCWISFTIWLLIN